MGDGFSNVMGTFTEKGLELISIPTMVRSDVYKDMINTAQNEMRRSNITKKERKQWRRQQDKALEGLADVHQRNCDTIIRCFTVVCLAILAGYKIFKKQ